MEFLKRFVLWSLVVWTAACTSPSVPPVEEPAQTIEPAALKAPAPPKTEKAFIWKAESIAEPETFFYLLGSIHVARADFYPLDPVIEDAFAASQFLAVEVDLSAISEANALRIVMEKAMLPKGETLEQKLTPETWKKVVDVFNELKIARAQISRFKPWFAAATIVALRVAKDGYTPDFGVDQYFMKKGGKEIIELKSAESQLALFDGLKPESEELLVVDAIEGSLQSGGDLEAVMKAWKKGDVEALHDLMFSGIAAKPEFDPLVERLFTVRNHQMADRIEHLLKEKNRLFVVVGAGHLIGEEGLVELFKKRGYRLVQLEKTGH